MGTRLAGFAVFAAWTAVLSPWAKDSQAEVVAREFTPCEKVLQEKGMRDSETESEGPLDVDVGLGSWSGADSVELVWMDVVDRGGLSCERVMGGSGFMDRSPNPAVLWSKRGVMGVGFGLVRVTEGSAPVESMVWREADGTLVTMPAPWRGGEESEAKRWPKGFEFEIMGASRSSMLRGVGMDVRLWRGSGSPVASGR